MPSKALACLATAALVRAVRGLRVFAGRNASRKEKSHSSGVHDPKGFAEAVERGDAAWQMQDLDRAIYYYVQAMNKSPTRCGRPSQKWATIEDARGNAALAEKAFRMAHDADPQEPRIRGTPGAAVLAAAERSTAPRRSIRRCWRCDPRRTRALDGMGEVCLAAVGLCTIHSLLRSGVAGGQAGHGRRTDSPRIREAAGQ